MARRLGAFLKPMSARSLKVFTPEMRIAMEKTKPTAEAENDGSKNAAEKADVEDKTRTPGDGTLTGAVPAGLTTEQLEELSRTENVPSDSGTG